MSEQFRLYVDLRGAALAVDAPGELARILRGVADNLADNGLNGVGWGAVLRDINGNSVGKAWV